MTKNKSNSLTSLEYAGLEALFQRIINTYEDTLGIREADLTPVSQMTRRTDRGIEVFDGAYDVYKMDRFAITGLYKEEETCKLEGFSMEGQNIKDCFDNEADISIDITPLLDESYIDLEWLMELLNTAGNA